jgi:hypothetical protein
LGALAIFVAIGAFDELVKGRVAVAAARLDLGGVKFVVAVARGGVDTEVLWIKGLDDDLTDLGSTTSSPSHLGQQREGAFGGRKVGQHQGNIV